MNIPVNLVYEDELSEYVLIKLLSSFEHKYQIGTPYNARGFGEIKAKINGYNQACRFTPYLVLTDLDDHKCPIRLINKWFKSNPHPNMIFRIAIKEVEAWLLADIEGFAYYTGVSAAKFPRNPENEHDPKKKLILLAKQSRKRDIREDIVPINENAQIGPNYNGRLMEFVFEHWNITHAMTRSDSLSRAYQRLAQFRFQAPDATLG
jgi:hypothetical protein